MSNPNTRTWCYIAENSILRYYCLAIFKSLTVLQIPRNISLIIFVMKTNQMYYLSLIYFVYQPLHISGIFIANQQEVFTVYVQQLVRVVLLS
jgi:hypothetical protein